jgi:hypothetical protein
METRIQSFDHNIGNYVRVLVGVGQIVDGKFVFDVPQQFQTYFIADVPERVNPMTGQILTEGITDYTDLLAMGNGNVTIENLWTIIDRIKARS